MREYLIKNLTDLNQLAIDLINLKTRKNLFLLYGNLGTGKTTLVQHICTHLGVKDPVSSPTFSIINEYLGKIGKIYHIDLYRLKDLDEAIHIGIEEYIYGTHLCFVEWPELIESIVPEHIKISIELLNDSGRKVIIL